MSEEMESEMIYSIPVKMTHSIQSLINKIHKFERNAIGSFHSNKTTKYNFF